MTAANGRSAAQPATRLLSLAGIVAAIGAASLGFIGWGAWRLRRKAKIACVEGYCATDRADRIARIGLWTAAVLIVIALVFPYLIRALITP